MLLALLPESESILKQDSFFISRFSQFLVCTYAKVKCLIGNEVLGLNLILIAECQCVLAFVLGDEFAYDGQLAILVFFAKDVKVAKFEVWHCLFVVLFHIFHSHGSFS